MKARRAAAAVVTFVLVMLLAGATTPAVAHSFLADTRPQQGARLSSSPREVVLQVSEPVAEDQTRVELAGGDGTVVETGRVAVDPDGLVVRLPLIAPLDDGIYRASWHVVSAVDGHESAGEFAFAVGDTTAGPAVSRPGLSEVRGVPWVASAATWLLLGGWSVAFGAGVLAVRHVPGGFPGRPRTWVRAGTLIALGGVGIRLAAAGMQGRAGLVASVTALALAAALALASTRRPWPAVVALVAVAAVWPGRSHGASEGTLGWLLDSSHLLAAGAWLGGLAVVAVALALARRRGDVAEAGPLAWAYARVALLAVAVLAGTGIAAAALLVPSPGDLVTDPYGQLVVAKAALFTLAVGAAMAARRRLRVRDGLATLSRLVRPELVLLVAATAVAAVLVDVAPPGTAAVEESLLGPPPIDGPVARAADMAGNTTVDVQAGDGRLDVHLRGPTDVPSGALTLTATLPDGTAVELHPRPCGQGCATLQYQLAAGTTRLAATITTSEASSTAELSLHWPPPPEQPALFNQMRTAMRTTPTVLLAEANRDETLGDPAQNGTRLTGDQFVQLMPWAGGGVVDVRPVPGTSDRFSFYLPGSTMWFDVTVDDRGRLLTQRLVNPGHDIRYRFAYPDE